ncbi:MAG: helix-turn-helix domain-containing protein [Clostridiales bacterium]|nr:helix-turn-helix domain-containing protein [Clostridiales bacterium]MDD6873582.1 helix-turn-helix domain-containing protein [Clostridiales bacterium]MDD7365978.1 helix-turn-helix domain-containing protein [Clostridiales bacterium]MDY2871689.1 helix-turn-helix domain-containing protein [Eubacteriales bacterium]
MNIMLLDTNGQVILPEGNDRELTLPEVLRSNPTQPLVYGGFTLIGTEGTQPLFLCLPGDSSDVCSCAILASELVSSMTRVELPNADREQTFRSILRGEVEGAEMETMALEHEIALEQDRCVVMLHLQNVDAESALNILSAITGDNSDDAVVEMDRHTLVLVKKLDEQGDYDDIDQLGQAIENTFMSEANHQVYIGIGEMKPTLGLLSESMREARRAIDVGRIYRKEEYVFIYRKMLIERFLADVPREMGQRYNSLLFNRKTARLFNDEMIHTIEKFFENSLNLSETARQLYIHRNTLIYRLDKVQRIIGLDLRAFDDAVTFKMMMLLGKNANEKGRRI